MGTRSAKPLEKVDLWARMPLFRPSSTQPEEIFQTGTEKIANPIDLGLSLRLHLGIEVSEKKYGILSGLVRRVRICLEYSRPATKPAFGGEIRSPGILMLDFS